MRFSNACVLGGAFIALFMTACSPVDEDLASMNKVSHQNDNNVILGKKIPNAYSIENMKKAVESLRSRGASVDFEIQTSHLYIRFLPQDSADMDALYSGNDLVLFDYPLDYEILTEGNRYRDVDISANQPNAQYTVVTVDEDIPNVPYEVLAELYLPNLDETSRSSSQMYSLEEEARSLVGLETPTESRGRWYPKGYIKFYDDVLKTNRPVHDCEVRARNGFRFRRVHTNSNGYFSMDRFYGDVGYSIKWEASNEKWDIRSGTTGQAFYNGPNNQKGNWNPVFSTNSETGFYAQIFDAAAYFVHREPFGITSKIWNISIGAYNESGRAYHVYPALWDGNGAAWGRDIAIYSSWSSGKKLTSKQIFSVVCHELGHRQHEEVRGNVSWNRDVDVKIKEAWAVGVAETMTKQVYGSFGTDWNYVSWNSIRGWGESKYTGIVLDLIDTQNRTSSSIYPIDRVSGYTLNQIHGSLNGATSWNSWRDKIRAISNPSSGYVNEIFNQYTTNL